jgi:hypothetical protein
MEAHQDVRFCVGDDKRFRIAVANPSGLDLDAASTATWIKPALVATVRHLRGEHLLRRATLTAVRGKEDPEGLAR